MLVMIRRSRMNGLLEKQRVDVKMTTKAEHPQRQTVTVPKKRKDYHQLPCTNVAGRGSKAV